MKYISLQTFSTHFIKRYSGVLVFSKYFLYFFSLFRFVFYSTFLHINRAQRTPPEIGTPIKRTPVTDKLTDVLVAPVTRTVSIDSSIDQG